MLTKPDENYPTLIREFGSYRISRKLNNVSYRASIQTFVIERNTPDIYGVPSWRIVDEVTPESNHDEWTIPLLESLYNDLTAIIAPTPLMDEYKDPPVDLDNEIHF